MELLYIPLLLALASTLLGKVLCNKWIWSSISLLTSIFFVLKLPVDPNFIMAASIVDVPWLGDSIRFNLKIDGLTWLLLLLTNGLIPFIIATLKEDKVQKITPLIFLMQIGLNGVFMAFDGLVFYIFWELAMIPIYFITLIYSEYERFKTTIRFFIYTFIGSLAMLASLIYMYGKTGFVSFSYDQLFAVNLSYSESLWVGLGFLLAFLIKIPVFPFHLWQPNTYVWAPAQGSMLLSGIMLKMGLYGLIRWYLLIVPESIDFYQPIVICLAVIGIVYGALIAIRQDDMKRVIAYSSLSHVGLIAAGVMTLSLDGLNGAGLQMLVHGINVVGLFWGIDLIDRTYKTRNIQDLGGIASKSKLFTVGFFLFVIGSVAAPLTNGFPGEFMLLKSLFTFNTTVVVFAGLTIILCAIYMLRMFQFSMLGDSEQKSTQNGTIINNGEVVAFIILSITVIIIGIFPQNIIDIINPSMDQILKELSNVKGVLS